MSEKTIIEVGNNVNVALRPLNYLSICAGIAGLDFGFELAMPGSRCVCMVEGEAYCAALLGQRMEENALAPAPIWSDVRTFDGRPWRGIVDCIIAGIPCQPHSVAGKQLGAADERDLWPDARRIIGEIGPALVFLENVGGAAGYFCGTVAPELERMGYRVAAGLFTAAEVGASHERERLFMLAERIGSRRQTAGSGHEQHARGQSEPGCVHMDDAKRTKRRKSKPAGYIGHRHDAGRPQEASRAGESDTALGNAASGQRQGHMQHHGKSNQAPAIWVAQSGHIDRPDAKMDHSPSSRCDDAGQRPEAIGESGQCVPGAGCNNIPLFAPGPGSAEWPGIIEQWPELAPATESDVRGVADGPSNRMDRLRGTGNAVVPLQAAVAFAILASALSNH